MAAQHHQGCQGFPLSPADGRGSIALKGGDRVAQVEESGRDAVALRTFSGGVRRRKCERMMVAGRCPRDFWRAGWDLTHGSRIESPRCFDSAGDARFGQLGLSARFAERQTAPRF